jgi:phosphatidylserine decarboxylase
VPEPNGLSQALALFSPMHKDGYKFVGIAAAVTVAAFLLSGALGLLCLIATLSIAFFFRDPSRMVPARGGLVIAPADGTVVSIRNIAPPPELDLGTGPLTCVSLFLSVFDVHVIRSPVSGRIKTSFYRPGRHRYAAAPDAAAVNECQGFAIETGDTSRIGAVLVAGTVARRIVTSAEPGDSVAGGERIGIIRFGSRADIYLPSLPCLLVEEGQRTIAGETVIADLDSHEPRRIFRRI